MVPTKAGLGAFVRHRATQLVAVLIIGLGVGAGGMALIGWHDGDRGVIGRTAGLQSGRDQDGSAGHDDDPSRRRDSGSDNRGGQR